MKEAEKRKKEEEKKKKDEDKRRKEEQKKPIASPDLKRADSIRIKKEKYGKEKKYLNEKIANRPTKEYLMERGILKAGID